MVNNLPKNFMFLFSSGFMMGVVITLTIVFIYMKFKPDEDENIVEDIHNEKEKGDEKLLNFDCTSREMWTPEKRKWCTDQGKWYDCRTKEMWSPKKKKWCDDNMNIMCTEHMDPVCDLDTMTEYSNLCKAPNIKGKYHRGKCIQE